MMRARHDTSGFSLIEVNLAILVIATGMLVLFSLFPAGLKQVETAQSNTQEAMFAHHVFSTLRGKAVQISNPVAWTNMTTFRNQVTADAGGATIRHGTGIVRVQFPPGSENYIRYILLVNDLGIYRRNASLWCQSGRYGAADVTDFMEGASKFYTEFFYSGMP